MKSGHSEQKTSHTGVIVFIVIIFVAGAAFGFFAGRFYEQNLVFHVGDEIVARWDGIDVSANGKLQCVATSDMSFKIDLFDISTNGSSDETVKMAIHRINSDEICSGKMDPNILLWRIK